MTERTHKDVVKSDISAWGQTAFFLKLLTHVCAWLFFSTCQRASCYILRYDLIVLLIQCELAGQAWVTHESLAWFTVKYRNTNTHTTPPNLFSNVMAAIAFSFFIFFYSLSKKKKIWHLQAVESWNETFGNTLLSAYKLNRRLNIETANWCYNKNFFFNSAQHVKSIF